jgi:uroporphyrinogen-III synthase
MPEPGPGGLGGLGVLVTRPEHQAADLSAAIEAAGGRAIRFPVIEIVPRAAADIAQDAAALPEPDIAVFVSTNAVRCGLDLAGRARIAAVGPATAAALEAAGLAVDIRPAAGFDSEHLLAEPTLRSVRGCNVRIIRGNAGRELIAETLRRRGARVDDLAVYTRRRPQPDAAALEALDVAFREGRVGVVTVMSVESLRNLVELLPDGARERLDRVRLVTPAARVLKDVLDRFPGADAVLADGPGAEDMVRAIAGHATGHSR